jgi:E3 ubiquitin-protein ligase HUWE1
LSKLASGLEDDLEFPPELGEVQFQFYRRPGHGERSTGAKTASTSSSSAPPPTFPQLAKTIASTSSASTSNSFSTPVKPKPKAVSDLKEGFKTPAPASTPSKDGPSSSTHDGLTSLNLGNVAKLSSTKSAMGVLADAVEEYQVPKEERFELLNKIRLAMGMGKKETRRKLLVIRCMAIATYCTSFLRPSRPFASGLELNSLRPFDSTAHLTLEPVAQTDLFLYEPELVSHIAELIHPEAGIPYSIMTAAIAALDAVSRYRHRIAEVISSINASANHGVIMSLFRATVLKLAEDGRESHSSQSSVHGFEVLLSL